jgi:hypothetical protein
VCCRSGRRLVGSRAVAERVCGSRFHLVDGSDHVSVFLRSASSPWSRCSCTVPYRPAAAAECSCPRVSLPASPLIFIVKPLVSELLWSFFASFVDGCSRRQFSDGPSSAFTGTVSTHADVDSAPAAATSAIASKCFGTAFEGQFDCIPSQCIASHVLRDVSPKLSRSTPTLALPTICFVRHF